jgi:hypothetical protein
MASFPFSFGASRAARPSSAGPSSEPSGTATVATAAKPSSSPPTAAALQGTGPRLGRELRRDPHRLSSHPAITGIRLSPYGVEATLVNISAVGALVRCNTRFKPDTTVTVVFQGTFTPSSVQGRVARSVVSSADKGVLWYDIGIAFDTHIPLREQVAVAASADESPMAAAEREAVAAASEPVEDSAVTPPHAVEPSEPATPVNRW